MKRILAFLLALCLMFGQVPATVFAVESGTAPDEIAEIHEEPEVTLPPVEEKGETLGATSGTCGDNLTWVISDDGVLTISGEGAMFDFTDGMEAPWMAHTDLFTSVVIEEGVTTVGIRAFANAVNMTSVELPVSLTDLGEEAFYMSGLTDLTLPPNLNFIGSKSLVCPNLTGIYVEDEAHATCYSRNGVLYTANSLVQVPGTYTGELELHSNTWNIWDCALMNCQNLTKLILPANIDQIGADILDGCTALTEIQFQGDAPGNVFENTFEGVTATISYPDANTTWTEEVKQLFGDNLTWTTHGENLVAQGYCGENALSNRPQVGTNADMPAGENATWVLTADGTMTISGEGKMGNFILFIGSNPWAAVCMNDPTRLTRVVIEEGITTVGEFAFADILGQYITEVVLPSTMEQIALYAFAFCDRLEKIHLPEGIVEIGTQAFTGCSALSEIQFLGDAPSIAEDAFTDVVATAYYPEGNSTWTEDVMQSYGGTITWEAYTPVISGACGDNLTWTIEEGVLTISGEGDMWNFGGEVSIPWMTYRDQFTSVVIEEGVTTVGDCAFGFHLITSVSLPETVTHIGAAAFSYTMNLTEVDLPDSLVSIGKEAFAMSALTEVTIPASVETIGAKAFVCPNLTAFHVDEANPNYYSQDGLLCRENQVIQVPAGYSGELELHTYSWVLEDYAMLYCGNVTKLILPANLNEIGAGVFAGCSSLTEIQFLGDAPATIAENAFADLSVIVSYPDANTTWTDEVKQSFGETVSWTTHGENLVARGYCGENQMSSQSGTLHFRDVPAGKNATWMLTSDGTMTISGTGRMVNSSPFAGTNPWARIFMNDSSRLTKIVIEEGITTVGEMAFLILGTYVTEVVLPSTVNTICYGAFGNLTALEQVEIPAGVNEIDVYAFFECTALSEIKFLGDAPAMAEDAFASVVATAYYPANNPTWTADVMQSYGGTITWEAYTPVYSGACGDNVTWILEGGVLTVSGEGDMWDFSEENPVPWYDYIGDVTSLVIEEGVTGIGDYAFCFLPISSVTIPETVTYIGDGAFSYTMGMGSAVLPESLTSIGDMAFFMSALCEVTIPASVTSIGLKVFVNCPLLTAIHVDEGNSKYYSWNGMLYESFTLLQVPGGCSGEVELHPFTYIIGEGAFMNCERITKLVIPSNTYEIGKDALSGCSGLTEILFHGSDPTIGENAFEGVTAVISHPDANATWTDEAKQIFGEAITWTTYGEDLVAWGICGENAIYDENGQLINHYSAHIPADNVMWKLTADGTMTVSGEGAMMNCAVFGGFTPWYTVYGLPTRLVIEEGITYVGEFSFMSFSEVTELVLPTTLQRVGAYAFNYMEKLEKVTIPEGTTVIPDILLAYNTALTSLDIPASVTSIGIGAVGGCTALTELRFHGDAPVIAEDAFTDVVATAYYPAGNPTWTADVMQSYGGTITWKPIVDAKVVASGWSGATTWKLYDNGTLLVFGNGKMKNYDYDGGQPWLNQGVDITHVIVAEGVAGIGSGAFKDLTTLKSVTFPATTLTQMGEAAFYGSGLESVEIPASLWTIQAYTFKNCVNLTSVTFHEGNLEKISDGAFYGTGLTELILPDCLDILDIFVFKGCENLTSITIGSGLTELREAVFYGTAIPTITIPEGITKIGPYAFKNCVKLETIDLPSTLTSVGEASFYADTALRIVELPDAVTEIGDYAFRKCESIETLKLSEELVTVGECAFYGCTGLKELVIPDKVTTIKPYAFKTCTGLTSVTLGSSVETIGEGAFNTCTGIKTIVFPASLKVIGDYCFSGSENLWKLTFLGDAPTIGTGAFKGLDAYAYYPSGNATWTTAVQQNYGGKITWNAK